MWMFSVAILLAAQQPEPSDLPVLVESFEGQSVSVDRVTFARTRGKAPFSLTFYRASGDRWRVDYTNSLRRHPYLVLSNLRHAQISSTKVGRVGARWIVAIPFGNNYPECFSNGDQVFDNVQISYDVSQVSVTVMTYDQCKAAYRTLLPVRRGEMLMVDVLH